MLLAGEVTATALLAA